MFTIKFGENIHVHLGTNINQKGDPPTLRLVPSSFDDIPFSQETCKYSQ